MEFILKINKNKIDELIVTDFTNFKKKGNSTLLFLKDKNNLKIKKSMNNRIYWLGDIVLSTNNCNKNVYLDDLVNNFNINKIIQTGGFFYCIRFDSQQKEIEIYNSFLSILPLYYYEDIDFLWISSSATLITKISNKHFHVSKKFILEKLLFNYPFRNQSLFEGIKLVPSNSFIKFDGKLNIIKHTEISDWFKDNQKSWEKSIHSLVDFFSNRVKYYFPDELFYLSFTGGFDGRTLLSFILDSDKNFITYSFGTSDSDDVIIPMKQSKKLWINYRPFILDDERYIKKSLKFGEDLIEISDGTANFARAHYAYAASEISKESRYIITGNFGSELFRAMHNTGVVISNTLFRFLTSCNIEKEISEIENAPELSFLPLGNYKDALNELKSDLSKDNLFKRDDDLNRKFYNFVFEEIFRKYFGAEIKMQSEKLINRSPFSDYSFIKELLKTKLAGVYSKFYENNPIKRFKGQVFYANLIKKSSDELYNMQTGKGYKPKDLITNFGKINLIHNFLKKRINKNNSNKDSFAVAKCLKYNSQFIKNWPINGGFFLKNSNNNLNKLNINDQINYYSLNWLITNQNKYE